MWIFILLFQTTAREVHHEVDTVINYNVQFGGNKYNGKHNHKTTDCPQKRPNPDVKVLHNELDFGKICGKLTTEKYPKGRCPISEVDCQQEFLLLENIGSEFTLSILFKVQCPDAGRMGMLRFGELTLDVVCGIHQSYSLVIGDGQKTYEYHIQAVDSYHHLLTQVIRFFYL